MYVRFLKILISALLAGMVILVFLNVVLRYAFNSGITVSEEISRILFVWMVFLGASVALYENGHIIVDVLTSRLPPAATRLFRALACIVMLASVVLILVGSWTQTLINTGAAMPASGASLALPYAAAVAFAVPAALMLVLELVRLGAGKPTT